MTFKFSRISKANLTSKMYLKRHFLNHPACFFWNRPLIDWWIFCFRCWNVYSAHCTGLELFTELPQNKICYILHPRHVFLLFPNNLQVCNLKVFILTKWQLLTPFLISWRKLTEMLFQASADKFCYLPTILLYILWKCKYWCIQIGLCNIM